MVLDNFLRVLSALTVAFRCFMSCKQYCTNVVATKADLVSTASVNDQTLTCTCTGFSLMQIIAYFTPINNL